MRDALRSAIEQEYAPLEIVVVDNHSTDGTWGIVTEFASKDRRIRALRNAENIGMARNFNACIAIAGGDFVLILCADDALEEGCVDLLASALIAHPGAVLSACGRILTDPALNQRGIASARQRKEEVDAARLRGECFAKGNQIGEPSAVMFRRKAASRGFHPDYSQAIDLEMWFHLLESGSAVLLPDPKSRIRLHDAQTTQENIRSGRIVRDKQLLFRQYARRLSAELTFLEKLEWDARLASSVARTRTAGGQVEVNDLAELFYGRTFRWVLCPITGLAWRLRGAVAAQRL
ncbi:MAG: glycosyltransferase family 2 protein [Betaproteobacteria bacterium]|nr:glycosyltransferase family 2 protein [Betaproteobacteria bacterium]